MVGLVSCNTYSNLPAVFVPFGSPLVLWVGSMWRPRVSTLRWPFPAMCWDASMKPAGSG